MVVPFKHPSFQPLTIREYFVEFLEHIFLTLTAHDVSPLRPGPQSTHIFLHSHPLCICRTACAKPCGWSVREEGQAEVLNYITLTNLGSPCH